MTETKLINCRKENLKKLGYKDLEDWLGNPNHVYIGREMSFYVKGAKGSKWANPFSVKKYGREKCIEMYRNRINENNELKQSLEELKGRTLPCWCSPEPCHGDVLLELLNGSN